MSKLFQTFCEELLLATLTGSISIENKTLNPDVEEFLEENVDFSYAELV